MASDYISHLWAVVEAQQEELRQPNPNPVVLAACDMFRAVCWKQAAGCFRYQQI